MIVTRNLDNKNELELTIRIQSDNELKDLFYRLNAAETAIINTEEDPLFFVDTYSSWGLFDFLLVEMQERGFSE